MSLNPSNGIAEDINGGVKVFPNLARRIQVQYPEEVLIPNAQEVIDEVSAQIRRELIAAGIPDGMQGNAGILDQAFGKVEYLKLSNGSYPEVPSKLVGYIHRWKFERSWYYYRASGSGIPPEFAIEFDKQWGRQVRVNGDCACRGAEFWGDGFAIDSYHIDTPEGLKAFIEMLGKVHKPRKRDE